MSTDYNPNDIWEALSEEHRLDLVNTITCDYSDELLAVLESGDANKLKCWFWGKIEAQIVFDQEFRSRWNLDAIYQPEPLKETLEDIAKAPMLLRRQAG